MLFEKKRKPVLSRPWRLRKKPTVASSRTWRGSALHNRTEPNTGKIRREGDLNPRYLVSTHAFQACTLNRSVISPDRGLAYQKTLPVTRVSTIILS